jgi:nuclear protein localization family protein 4
MILRFFSREGQFRLDVQPTTTFKDIIPQVSEKLPKSVDIASISVSNRPQGGDHRKLNTLKGVTFAQVGLRYA